MEKLNIYEKLFNIQQELKAPKGQYNDFGKYKYRSCEDIFEAVKPLLQKYKCLLLTNDELHNVGDRYYIKAVAKLIDMEQPYIDEDEYSAMNCIINIGWAREEETKKNFDGSQITGASSSYARKYALNGMFLIDDNKDSDTTNVGEEVTEKEAKEFTFLNGKYKGKTILQVAENDEGYLEWWIDNGKDERIKKMITLLTGIAPTEIPSEEEQTERLNLIKDVMDLADKTNTDIENINSHYETKSLGDMTTEQLKETKKVLEQKL